MGIDTGIQWADSTLNLQMGCEGCELVKGRNRKKPTCYAKLQTDRYAGKNGWPNAFEEPKIFMERLKYIAKWSDLKGTERPLKPWLNGLPRIIFLNDMGDTFSSGMPKDWFAEALPTIRDSPHIFMLLTKWPNRMAEFSRRYTLPENIWPGATVTEMKTRFRAKIINEDIKGGGLRWLSVEPMWQQILWESDQVDNIRLFIYGGESGNSAKHFNIKWLDYQIKFCKFEDKLCFVKQLGSKPFNNFQPIKLKDFHGGDINEWEEKYRVRQFTKF